MNQKQMLPISYNGGGQELNRNKTNTHKIDKMWRKSFSFLITFYLSEIKSGGKQRHAYLKSSTLNFRLCRLNN